MKTHLIIHHTLTEDGDTLSWPAIRRTHLEKGWVDIGYHWGVEWSDRGYNTAHYEILAGRPMLARAAGEPKWGMNRKGVHVAFVGNYDIMEPPMEMWRFAMPHLADIIDALDIPIENVLGHREISNVGSYKQCPGAKWDMDKFRHLLGGQS